MAGGPQHVPALGVIGWILRRWQKKYPGLVLVVTLVLLAGGTIALVWWVLDDLRHGRLLRPAIAVMVLTALSVRLIMSFRPYRR